MNASDASRPGAPLRMLSSVAAVTSVVAGALVLLGWRFGFVGPLTGANGFRAMQPNTALAFILGGASLLYVVQGRAGLLKIGRVLALAMGAIGLVTLGEAWLRTGLGFYRLLAPFLRTGARLGPMSAVSASCLTLLSLSLLGLGRSRNWRRVGHVSAMAATLLATVVIVDYAYNLTLQFRVASQSVMAPHAALTFVALGIGILAADTGIGLVRELTDGTPGAALTRALLPVVVGAPFVLGWVRLQAERFGYLGAESGVAVLAASSAAVCATVVLIYARRLDEIDEVRSAAETRLRESAQFYRQILDSAQEGIVVTDRESRFLLWNHAMVNLSGLPESDVLGYRLLDMFPSFNDPRSFEAISRVLRGETAERFDAQRPFSQANHWFAVSHTSLRSDRGNVTGVIVTYRDITDRRHAEEALVESSRINQQIIDNVRDGIAVFDRNLNLVAVNPFLEALTGIADDTALGRHVFEVFPQAHRQGLEGLQRALDGETTEWPDVRQVIAGRETWSWTRLSPLRRADGSISGALAVTSDISERKRTELALGIAQERTTLALAAARMAVWEIDLDTRKVVWSENLAALFGRPLESLGGELGGGLRFVHQDDGPRVKHALDDAIANRSGFAADFRILLPDGEVRWLSHAGHMSETGEHGPRLLGITMDVTDRRILEAQLRQAQKMEAVGQLAGGIAHDFNNLLTAILGYSDLLTEVVTDPNQARDIKEITGAATRAAALTRQLLAFSRREPTEITALDFNHIIGELTNMLQRLIGEHVELGTVLGADLHSVRGDRAQLEQVVMNLVVNARDAMPRGGSIRIETSNVYLAADAIERTLVKAGPYVRLTVSDTGVGIADAVRPRIFEPFFTTKEPGKGTGLGLATVYGIVTQANGYVSVYSELGHGTTFKIHLPAVAGDAAAIAAADGVDETAIARSGVVLVVEDEDAVRSLAVTMLERVGYRVLAAGNPQEGEVTFHEHGGEVGLLLTDVIMPGGSGPDLYRRLSARRPDLRVLYMSGYTGQATLDQRRLDAGAPFLQKPFTAEALLRAVRQVLSA